MEKITSINELRQAIVTLEYERAVQKKLMKEQFEVIIDHLKPANIIKNTLRDLTTTPGLKESLYGATMGFASGYLTKRIIVGRSHGFIKNILGSLLQSGVSNAVSKKPRLFMTITNTLLKFFQGSKS